MLKIYDTNHNAIGHIVKYKDLKIEGDVTTGDRTLSFTYMARHHEICEEFYIETQDDEYVVKEKSVSTDGFGLSTLFQTNFFRLFFRYCTGV